LQVAKQRQHTALLVGVKTTYQRMHGGSSACELRGRGVDRRPDSLVGRATTNVACHRMVDVGVLAWASARAAPSPT
jgi:hypothetical protein